MTRNSLRNKSISTVSLAVLLLLGLIATALPVYAQVTDSSITFTNTTLNDSGSSIAGNKVNERVDDVVFCRGTSVLSDLINTFICDYSCASSDSECSDDFANAISYVKSNNGGSIVMRQGTYPFGTDWSMNDTNNTLIQGKGNVTITMRNAKNAFTGYRINNLQIRGITIDGGNQTTGTPLKFWDINYFVAENVNIIKYPERGIWLQTDLTNNSNIILRNVRVTGNSTSQSSHFGITGTFGANTLFEKVSVIDADNSGIDISSTGFVGNQLFFNNSAQVAIQVTQPDPSGYMTLMNVEVLNSKDKGIILGSDTSTRISYNVRLLNFKVYNTTGYALYAQYCIDCIVEKGYLQSLASQGFVADHPPYDRFVTRDLYVTNSTGASVYGDSMKDALYDHLVIENGTSHGMQLFAPNRTRVVNSVIRYNGADGIYLQKRANDVIIETSEIYGNGKVSASSKRAIEFDVATGNMSWNIVRNNRIFNDEFGTNMTIGVYENGASASTLIVNNSYYGNEIRNVSNTRYLIGNQSYVDQYTYTGTLPNCNTAGVFNEKSSRNSTHACSCTAGAWKCAALS